MVSANQVVKVVKNQFLRKLLPVGCPIRRIIRKIRRTTTFTTSTGGNEHDLCISKPTIEGTDHRCGA